MRTLLVVLAFALLVALAILSFGTLLSIFLATVLALGLDPPAGALVRRAGAAAGPRWCCSPRSSPPSSRSCSSTAGPVWDQIVEFVQRLPAYWDELAASRRSRTSSRRRGADDTSSKCAAGARAGPARRPRPRCSAIAGGVFGSVLSLVTLTFLSLFLLMERPTITDWLFGFTPPAAERRWQPVVEDSITAVSSSLIGNVAISIVAATVAGLSAWAFGLPFPLVLAVITGLLDLIPQVGATIAAVILVAVALTVSTGAAIAMLVIQLIYQQVENYIVYPIVYRRAVELSRFTTIVAVLIAGSLLGVVGRSSPCRSPR